MGSLLDRLLHWLFGTEPAQEIHVSSGVLRDIMMMARQNHPKEFSAYLAGKQTKTVVRISHVMYQEFHADHKSTWIIDRLPMLSGSVGTVHSHPSGGNLPSTADKRFFERHGRVHLIIAKPYVQNKLAAYDARGRHLPVRVKVD